MISDKINENFLNRYLEKKEQECQKNHVSWINIAASIFLYITTIYFQAKIKTQIVNGIISQIQVMISVYIVLSNVKIGYTIAVIINIAESLLVALEVFVYGDIAAAPGMIVPIATMITVTIIFMFSRRLNIKLKETKKQKEELAELYEELSSAEEELNRQNKQLHLYNQEMKENEKKLNQLAFFDELTELPNRKMIINRLDFLINISTKKKLKFAVAFIDLDNFKKVNDSMGHSAGDLLLQKVTSKLKSIIHPEDMLARIGGDEFALIIEQQLDEKGMLKYVESLRTALSDTITIEKNEFSISASFGISIYPQDGSNSMELLKCADTAMYKVKGNEKNGIKLFDRKMKEEILRRVEFESKLLNSIEKEELFLVFQPQYDTVTKQLRGFEALARWHSRELGFISPIQFIPIAEETKFINSMGKWIIKTVCEKFKYIRDKYDIDIIMSLNVSPVQLAEPLFAETVKDILKETGVGGQFLEFEITESVFISSMENVIEVLNELKDIGIHIALDDFGTGYSSLSYVQLLPIDTLKIDKLFVDSINVKDTKNHIVGSVINLFHDMDISIIAEGIENKIQLEYLKNHGCDYVQGFLWGKPLNEEGLNQLLNRLSD
jgi:diguanylate cyclase (GGDEF)-like protein